MPKGQLLFTIKAIATGKNNKRIWRHNYYAFRVFSAKLKGSLNAFTISKEKMSKMQCQKPSKHPHALTGSFNFARQALIFDENTQ